MYWGWTEVRNMADAEWRMALRLSALHFLCAFAGFGFGLAAAGPIVRVCALAHIPMECRIRPIGYTFDMVVPERVDMYVIDVVGVIGLVAQSMFAKPPLPNAAFAAGRTHRREALRFW